MSTVQARVDVVICNPPFFETRAEKKMLERPNFEAKQEEVCCEGGELGFITRILEESIQMPDPPALFAMYVGKKETLGRLTSKFLGDERVKFFSETLYQGNTARWVLFWRVVTAGRTYNCNSTLDTRRGLQTTSRYEERGPRAGN